MEREDTFQFEGALRMTEAMREVGCNFYQIKVMDEAFKNRDNILNRMCKGLSSSEVCDDDDIIDRGEGGVSYTMGEEIIDFNEDADYQLIDSLK